MKRAGEEAPAEEERLEEQVDAEAAALLLLDWLLELLELFELFELLLLFPLDCEFRFFPAVPPPPPPPPLFELLLLLLLLFALELSFKLIPIVGMGTIGMPIIIGFMPFMAAAAAIGLFRPMAAAAAAAAIGLNSGLNRDEPPGGEPTTSALVLLLLPLALVLLPKEFGGAKGERNGLKSVEARAEVLLLLLLLELEFELALFELLFDDSVRLITDLLLLLLFDEPEELEGEPCSVLLLLLLLLLELVLPPVLLELLLKVLPPPPPLLLFPPVKFMFIDIGGP